MTIDKDKLRALAEAATQGDWGQDGTYFAKARQEDGTTYVESWRPIGQAFSVEDAKFIAASNPATILALLGEIDSLRQCYGNISKDRMLYVRQASEALKKARALKAENADYKSGQDRYEQIIENLKAELKGYKQGAKAEADAADEARAEVRRLKAENEALRKALGECADELCAEIICKHGGQKPEDMHPVTRRLYDRDMASVIEARAALSKEQAAPGQGGDA